MRSKIGGNNGEITCMECTTARKVLAQRVRMLRSAHGWSQEVLADLSGLNRSYIGAVERFEHNIGLDNIEKIAAAFAVSVADLVSSTQTAQFAAAIGKGDIQKLDDVDLPAVSDRAGSAVTINRKTFTQLLTHCQDNQRESVFNYLRFRGVTVID